MAMSINTNVLSLNAQRNLSTSAADLATSLQRLSSGLRRRNHTPLPKPGFPAVFAEIYRWAIA